MKFILTKNPVAIYDEGKRWQIVLYTLKGDGTTHVYQSMPFFIHRDTRFFSKGTTTIRNAIGRPQKFFLKNLGRQLYPLHVPFSSTDSTIISNLNRSGIGITGTILSLWGHSFNWYLKVHANGANRDYFFGVKQT